MTIRSVVDTTVRRLLSAQPVKQLGHDNDKPQDQDDDPNTFTQAGVPG